MKNTQILPFVIDFILLYTIDEGLYTIKYSTGKSFHELNGECFIISIFKY